jgi:hypothetical protein
MGMSYSYFEVTILEYAPSDDSKSLESVIGLTGEFTNLVHALPGWNVWSVGYHSDNGGIYEQRSNPIATTKPYSIGQTVGCGIDYESSQYFFTCDGVLICKCQLRFPCFKFFGQDITDKVKLKQFENQAP